MRWKKLLSSIICVLTLFSTIAFSQEVDKSEPYDMMMQVSEKLFERLKNENQTIRTDPELLKVVVEEELMPYINYRYSAFKVLGSHVKKAKKADVYAFAEAFRGYLVTSYAQVLTLYTDQVVEFEKKKTIPTNKTIASIKVSILDNPRPPIKLEFKLKKNKKKNEWLAFDMIAEGVSLLSSKKAEWSSKLRKEGLPAVTEELNRLAETPIRFEGNDQ